MSVNCQGCRFWTPLLGDRGSCELAELKGGVPVHEFTRMVVAPALDEDGLLFTHRYFCCQGFSRRGGATSCVEIPSGKESG